MVSTRSSSRSRPTGADVGGDVGAPDASTAATGTIPPPKSRASGASRATATTRGGTAPADYGQPEVTSPAKQQLLPALVEEEQQAAAQLASPMRESLVKSVGKPAAASAGTRLPPPPTPSAGAVRASSQMPLPGDDEADDAGQGAGVASRDQDEGPAPATARPGVSLPLAFFMTLSLLATLSIGTAVTACWQPAVHAALAPHVPHLGAVCAQATGGAASLGRALSEGLASVPATLQQAAPLALSRAHALPAMLHAWALEEVAPSAQLLLQQAHGKAAAALLWAKAHAVSAINDFAALVRPAPALPATFQSTTTLAALQALLDSGAAHLQHAADTWELAAKQFAERRKALAVVLTCGHAAECAAAAAAAASNAMSPCALPLSGAGFADGDAAGALQAALAAFLGGCPAGAVVVEAPERLSLPAVAVLNAALSESGHVQAGGRAVDTSRALYVFVYQAAGHDEAAVKEQLMGALAAQVGLRAWQPRAGGVGRPAHVSCHSRDPTPADPSTRV